MFTAKALSFLPVILNRMSYLLPPSFINVYFTKYVMQKATLLILQNILLDKEYNMQQSI